MKNADRFFVCCVSILVLFISWTLERAAMFGVVSKSHEQCVVVGQCASGGNTVYHDGKVCEQIEARYQVNQVPLACNAYGSLSIPCSGNLPTYPTSYTQLANATVCFDQDTYTVNGVEGALTDGTFSCGTYTSEVLGSTNSYIPPYAHNCNGQIYFLGGGYITRYFITSTPNVPCSQTKKYPIPAPC